MSSTSPENAAVAGNVTTTKAAPPVSAGPQENVRCRFCYKMLKNARGLNTHLRSCQKKKDLEQNTNVSQENNTNSQVAENSRPSADTPVNRGVWGPHSAEEIYEISSSIYDEIIYWKNNIFTVPSGAAGKRYLQECTRLIDIWTEDQAPVSHIALKMLMCMPKILLQKPFKKSKSKLHSVYLNKRLDLWKNGKFDELMKENRSIQEKLRQGASNFETPEHIARVFARLISQNKIHAALRLLDKNQELGVAELTDANLQILKSLHPDSEKADESILMNGELPYFDPIIFNNIDETSISKAANRTRGAAGPSGMDADAWRRCLISKNFGKTGKELRIAIAKMTQQLCTREVNVIPGSNRTSIEAYTSCRLIPLEKAPSGIRPIGIGEVLRRIIGKAIVTEIRPDIIQAAGSIQVCAGQKAGCEAAAHAMKEIFEDADSDAVLFIDASNAFNSINREAMLHNIRYLCPPMATYMRNCYGIPARLFVAGGVEIQSAEGTTQGDPIAMPAYGIGILPLLSVIKPAEEGDRRRMKHVAYADDLAGGSKLKKIREWWDKVVENGPKYGYFPKASKSWLVVKADKEQEARVLFDKTDINITIEGRKYLGGHTGTEGGKEDYVGELVEEWVSQLEVLSEIAKSEPQAEYSAFTAGFKHKLTYFIRTIPGLSELVKPVDDIMNKKFIPAITDRSAISEEVRRLLSLPVKLGGLGIPIFSECAPIEYENSRKLTETLMEKILAQETEYIIDEQKEREKVAEQKREKEQRNQLILEDLRGKMSKKQTRANDLAQLKGASAWLTSLPLQSEGYVLNKREFYDALALRYRWHLKYLPTRCQCGHDFTMDHAMQCQLGGYVHRRHDHIRDLFAKLLDVVADGVEIEPRLQPLSGEVLPPGSNIDDESRLDFAGKGFWQNSEMAFFDVKVFSPFAKSHVNKNLDALFKSEEKKKKDKYNDRVIQIEHGSFTPVVLSSSGGFGREGSCFVSRLIDKIAEKQGTEKSLVANYVRSKVSFELVRAQVACIRGSRSLKKISVDVNEIEVVEQSSQIRDFPGD